LIKKDAFAEQSVCAHSRCLNAQTLHTKTVRAQPPVFSEMSDIDAEQLSISALADANTNQK